jgi:methyl-accepting chemotaxis protein
MAADPETPIRLEEIRELVLEMRTSLQQFAATSAEQLAEVKKLAAFTARYSEEFRQALATLTKIVQSADRLARVAIGLLLRKGLAQEQDIQQVLRELADEEFADLMRRMLGEPEAK